MPSKPVWLGFKGKDGTPWEVKSYGRKGCVFEAWVNEALLLIWGVEERMSERMPVMQTDIPADGSFHSKDKCYITAAVFASNNSCRLRRGGMKWIVQQCCFDWAVTPLFSCSSGNTESRTTEKKWKRETIIWANKAESLNANLQSQCGGVKLQSDLNFCFFLAALMSCWKEGEPCDCDILLWYSRHNICLQDCLALCLNWHFEHQGATWKAAIATRQAASSPTIKMCLSGCKLLHCLDNWLLWEGLSS